jgi:hypothetical protein
MRVSGLSMRGAGQEVFRGLVALCAGFRMKPASNSRGKIANGNRGRCDKKFKFFIIEGSEHMRGA